LKQKQQLKQAIESCFICKKWQPATCRTHWQQETKLPCRAEIEHLENIKSNLIFLKKMKVNRTQHGKSNK
jgi:hypothetical protein